MMIGSSDTVLSRRSSRLEWPEPCGCWCRPVKRDPAPNQPTAQGANTRTESLEHTVHVGPSWRRGEADDTPAQPSGPLSGEPRRGASIGTARPPHGWSLQTGGTTRLLGASRRRGEADTHQRNRPASNQERHGAGSIQSGEPGRRTVGSLQNRRDASEEAQGACSDVLVHVTGAGPAIVRPPIRRATARARSNQESPAAARLGAQSPNPAERSSNPHRWPGHSCAQGCGQLGRRRSIAAPAPRPVGAAVPTTVSRPSTVCLMAPDNQSTHESAHTSCQRGGSEDGMWV